MSKQVTEHGLKTMFDRAKTLLPDVRPHEIDPGQLRLPDNYSQLDVQDAATVIARHYGLQKPIVIQYMDLVDTTPAQIMLSEGNLLVPVTIDSDNMPRPRFTPRQILCLLAHELAHEFIFERGIGFERVRTNELFTDFMAVYLGCGQQMIEGCEIALPKRMGHTVQLCTSSIGYLTKKQLKKAQRMVYGTQGYTGTPHSIAPGQQQAKRRASRPVLSALNLFFGICMALIAIILIILLWR